MVTVSGLQYQQRQAIGKYHASGDFREIAVDASGELAVHVEISDIVTAKTSGQVADISGQPVSISGQPVDLVAENISVLSGQISVLSGEVHVISGEVIAKVSGEAIIISGQPVSISGQPVDLVAENLSVLSGQISVSSGEIHVISGEVIAKVSGEPVKISGETVIADVSGQWIIAWVSGEPVKTSGEVANISGQPVSISGQPVDIAGISGEWVIAKVSGEPVKISGETIISSISGQPVSISGQPVDLVAENISVLSGQISVSSGEVHIISGEVISKISGETVLLTDLSGNWVEACVDGAIKTAPAKTRVEHFETIAGVIPSADVTGIALSTNHRGRGRYSVEFDKTGTTQAYAQISRAIIPSKDLQCYSTHAWLMYYLYLDDITNVTAVYFAIGTDASNYWYWQTDVSELSAGWNHIHHGMHDIDGSAGAGCDLANVGWVAVRVVFGAVANTLDDIRVDDCVLKRAWELGSYRFNVTSGFVAVHSGLVGVTSGQVSVLSGEIHIMSGDIDAQVSGAVQVSGIIGVSGEVSILSGEIHIMSGEVIAKTSGEQTRIEGYYHASGDWRPLAVDASGELDLAVEVSSGLHVNISGSHVFQESGAHVLAQVTSGVVDIASGLHVEEVAMLHSGQVEIIGGVQVSGTVAISGDITSNVSGQWVEAHILSGDIDAQVSGAVQVSGTVEVSGEVYVSGHVTVISGVIDVASGLHVEEVAMLYSGQVEIIGGVQVSGTVAISGDITTDVSGQPVHIGCADTIRIGNNMPAHYGSGGRSLCASGWVCSGSIHSIIIKSFSGNCPIYIGGTTCKPYSGYGFALEAQEAINLDICSPCDVYTCGTCDSGNRLTWIGTDY